MARPGGGAFTGGAGVGFLLMAVMAFTSVDRSGANNVVLLGVAGMAAASAMILPGVSGAYLFLVLGQYKRILGAIDQVKEGAIGDAMPVVVPVGIGVVLGVVVISNLVRWTLKRYEQATLGVLMGLLCGSVLGIYPFANDAATAGRVVAAVALCAAGFAITRVIDRIGN